MSHHTIAKLAATALVITSCGFGGLFAFNAGLPHGITLAVLSLVFAVSLECIKPLAVSAAIQAASQFKLVRCLLLTLLGGIAVLYSLTAELSLTAGSRSDHAASRQDVINSSSRSSERYTTAKTELAAIAPARLVAEIEADKLKTKNELRLAKLDGEIARAKRRQQLQAIMSETSGVEPTFAQADPGSSAIAMYLGIFGYTIDAATIAQLLYLVPVLALELGSALSMVLVSAFPAPNHGSQGTINEPSITGNRLSPAKLEAAKRVTALVIANGGSLLKSERAIAKAIGSDRNTTRRALEGLGVAGLLEHKPTKKGTEIKLVN